MFAIPLFAILRKLFPFTYVVNLLSTQIGRGIFFHIHIKGLSFKRTGLCVCKTFQPLLMVSEVPSFRKDLHEFGIAPSPQPLPF